MYLSFWQIAVVVILVFLLFGRGKFSTLMGDVEKVIKRFKVDIVASWKDDIATLDEKFIYSDGSKSSRIWKLKKISSNQFEGTAGDVEGVAEGETAGNAFYFEYDLNLPVDDTTYVVNFEDWMFLMDENTLLSRSYMSKWGFDVGEVTLVMTKTL